jgi:hypothetical protein
VIDFYETRFSLRDVRGRSVMTRTFDYPCWILRIALPADLLKLCNSVLGLQVVNSNFVCDTILLWSLTLFDFLKVWNVKIYIYIYIYIYRYTSAKEWPCQRIFRLSKIFRCFRTRLTNMDSANECFSGCLRWHKAANMNGRAIPGAYLFRLYVCDKEMSWSHHTGETHQPNWVDYVRDSESGKSRFG